MYTLRQPTDAAPGPRGGNQPWARVAPIGGAGLWATPDCNTKSCATAAGNPLVLGNADGLAIAALGGTMARAKEELAKGRVVVFGPRGNRGEQPVTIHAGSGDVTVPGYVIERGFAYGDLPGGLMPASVAQAHGWGTEDSGYYISYPASTTRAQENRALDAAAALGAAALIERGPEKPTNTPLLIAIIAAAFITLAGAAISIALSAAEGRADLAARRGRRRAAPQESAGGEPGARDRRRRLPARRRARDVRRLHGAIHERHARLRRTVGEPGAHGPRRPRAGHGRGRGVHAVSVATRPTDRVIGSAAPGSQEELRGAGGPREKRSARRRPRGGQASR